MAWCGRRDSNPHDLRHWNLNPARLPIPPRPPATFRPPAVADSLSHRKMAKLSGKPRLAVALGAPLERWGHIYRGRSSQSKANWTRSRWHEAQRTGPGHPRCRHRAKPLKKGVSAAEMEAQAHLELVGGKVVHVHGRVVREPR